MRRSKLVERDVVLRLNQWPFRDPELFDDEFRDLDPLFQRVIVPVGIKQDHPDDGHEEIEVIDPELNLAHFRDNLAILQGRIKTQLMPETEQILIRGRSKEFTCEAIVEPCRCEGGRFAGGHHDHMHRAIRRQHGVVEALD